MKKLLSIMILVLFASVSFAQLGGSLTQKKADTRYAKNPSTMPTDTVEQFKEKLGLNNSVLLRDSVYIKAQIDAKFESLFAGTYYRNGYNYRVQRDSAIVPNWSGIKTAIAGWELDDATGTTAATAVVGGPTGAALGTVTVNQTGKIGKAYSVVTDGRVNFANSGSLFNFSNTDFTFSIWINPNGVSGSQTVWCLGYDIIFYLNNNFLVFDAGASGAVSQTSNYLSASTWTLVTVTYTKLTKTLKIYKNGAEVTTSGTMSANPSYNNNQFRIGNIGGSIQYNGLYDQCLIWKSALTADQINTYLWKNGNGTPYNQL